MKCPKCSYISFDFNELCPKCSKDVSDTREKMNLPTYRPNPLPLLGSLTGEVADSSLDLEIGRGGEPGMGAVEEAFQEGDHLEFSPDEPEIADLITVSPEDRGTEEEPSLDLSDLSLEDSGLEAPPVRGTTLEEAELEIDLEDLSLEDEAVPTPAAPDRAPRDPAEWVTSEIDMKKLKALQDSEDTPPE